MFLQCNGKEIKWQHIVDLYERNAGRITETPGLSIAHKLKYEHIKLTNFSKMRVDLAAQVRLELGYKHVCQPAFFLTGYECKCSKGTETDWWRGTS